MHFLKLLRQTNHDVWPRFQSLLKLLLWTKDVEWVKVHNVLGPLCPWQCLYLCLYLKTVQRAQIDDRTARQCGAVVEQHCWLIILFNCTLHTSTFLFCSTLHSSTFQSVDSTFKCTLHSLTTPFNCTLTLKWVHLLLFNSITVQTKYTISLVKYVICRLQNKLNTDYSAIFVFVYLCATCIVEGRSIQRGALIDDCFQLWRPAVICPMIDHTLPHTLIDFHT